MSKFSDFVKDENNIKKNKDTVKEDKKDIEELIHKYSEYSESELFNEFKKESEKRKSEFSDDKLNSIKSVLDPYLNENQKQKLNDLLNMVK